MRDLALAPGLLTDSEVLFPVIRINLNYKHNLPSIRPKTSTETSAYHTFSITLSTGFDRTGHCFSHQKAWQVVLKKKLE